MLRVEGPETTAAITRARHHTPGTVPLILEVAVTLLLGCPLARDGHIHRLKQSRPGAESYGLYLEDGRQFHFRPGPGNHGATSIHVFDSYRNGKLVVELKNDEAVWKFFEGLKAEAA